MKLKKFKRKAILCKEGDQPQYVYIVKEGELEVKKNVYEMRNCNEDYDLLNRPSTTKKFNNNFARVQGTKVTNVVSVSINYLC
jgi:hypothetical protein